MSRLLNKRFALIGAGNMGFALLAGWAGQGLQGEAVTVIEPNPSAQLQNLCKTKGFNLFSEPKSQSPSDAIVLAIKPQMLDESIHAAEKFLHPGAVLISILAGKSIKDLSARFPQVTSIVRAMPNTPAAVGRGMTGLYANDATSVQQRDLTESLLSPISRLEWLSQEKEIDMLTAISGSGPAYVFYLVESLAAAGVKLGLSTDVSQRLARATIEGAGELLHQMPNVSAEELRRRVTSPGGTTAAALAILMKDDGLSLVLEEAVIAARRRAEELAG
ncbi:MAG: pyrroline-5-carboxylate reductase [Methylocystis sp.]